MAEMEPARANPEKRLFISLLTRDIPLADAFLDLIDNSINSALLKFNGKLETAEDFAKHLLKPAKSSIPEIRITVEENKISIRDSSEGIEFSSARDGVFTFGRAAGKGDKGDRLSVYGVGLKRAIFKMGNKILMESDHLKGGFALDMDVKKWESDKRSPWVIDISKRQPKPKQTGTTIKITQLYDDVKRRVSDGLFIKELKEKIRRTYILLLGRVANIFVNEEKMETLDFIIGDNASTESFSSGSVSCNLIAGIGNPNKLGNFLAENAGWFVFCNGRAVIFADKTELTGWTGSPELPLFQPKHRPFVGVANFVSADPEQLPWTTTKSAINRESGIWQEARKRMISIGRTVTSVLDKRYNNEGTEIPKGEVKALHGKAQTFWKAATSSKTSFSVSKLKDPDTIKIQYDANSEQVEAIRKYLNRRSMSGSEVGRYTFSYFLKNRAGYDDE